MSDNDRNESYFNDEDARIIAERVAAIKAQKAAKAKQTASAEAPTRAVERNVPDAAKANADELARQQAEARKRAADIARKQAEQARLEAEAKAEAVSEDEEELLSAFSKLDKETPSKEPAGFKYKMVDNETAEIDSEVNCCAVHAFLPFFIHCSFGSTGRPTTTSACCKRHVCPCSLVQRMVGRSVSIYS